MSSFPRFAAFGPFFLLFASLLACGATTTTGGGVDSGGTEDAASADSSTRHLPDGAACSVYMLTITDDDASSNPGGSSSGGVGCTKDADCTVRFQGDYCSCRTDPRPMTVGSAMFFDENLNGRQGQCNCPMPEGCGQPKAGARCDTSANKCVLQ